MPIKLSKIYKNLLNEDLNYEFSDTTGPEDDEFKIGMVTEMANLDDFRFNNGSLNKVGPNTLYYKNNPIVDFGIGKIGSFDINGHQINNALYLMGGYNASNQNKGYGTIGLQVLFSKLPKIENLVLQCYKTAYGFWKKMGGEIIQSKEISKDNPLYTMVINRNNFPYL